MSGLYTKNDYENSIIELFKKYGLLTYLWSKY